MSEREKEIIRSLTEKLPEMTERERGYLEGTIATAAAMKRKMNDLVYLKNDEAVCSSVDVAEKFHKRHTHVIRAIENIFADDSAQNWIQCFKKTSYKDESGKLNKMYLMNRDGFSLLVMGFTGKKALEWKWKYIQAFNAMETFIREKCSAEWLESRQTGKVARQTETAVLQEFVEYAKANGSSHAEWYYKSFSDMANKAVGISSRELATVQQLNQLLMVENIIANNIRSRMEQGQPYKEIFKDCKKRIALFKDIAYLKSVG